MTQPPLRCHLLIGPPGSGKTTLARDLAPLLTGDSGEPGLVLSTDAIRAELFGDAAVQGPWDEISALLLMRLHEAVAKGRPVIIDATHARRPWRLLYTQHLAYSRPVEWIGWWLTTPLPTCLEWALRRERPVPEAVIKEFHAAINHRQFGPCRPEGLAALVSLNPAAGEATPAELQRRLDKLDGQIRNAVNRERGKLAQRHRYSRLLDLERLLFLLRLLTSFNGLDTSDPATASALSEICSPLPEGDLAERASVYLSRWSEVHGGNSEVYSDVEALRADLAWLEASGFTRLDWQADGPIDPGPFTEPTGGEDTRGGVHGGYPSLADPAAFRRVFTLLRHILKHPFDAPSGSSSGPGLPLYQHLIDRLSDIDGSYTADQEATLRKDLEGLLRPYGFAPEVKGRPASNRQGYAIGTALLSADQLLEVHSLLKASMERLSDASQKPLLLSLEERLRRSGLMNGSSAHRNHGRRALAHRSFTEERKGTLAALDQSERIERAIKERRRVWLRHLPDVVTDEQRQRGDDGRFRAWPLQLLFHNISWYLAFEFDSIGTSEGLIRTLRVDRLVLHGLDGNVMRSQESQHERAMARLNRLLHICGGLWFGNDLDAQLAVMPAEPSAADAAGKVQAPAHARAQASASRRTIPGRDWYDTLRFSCTPQVFQLIREEPNRFPPEHTAYSRPIPGHSSWSLGPLDTLAPNPATDSHPYPVELQLPRWTLESDWDLRAWLFRWGAGVRVETPPELREQHLQQARGVVELYGTDATISTPAT